MKNYWILTRPKEVFVLTLDFHEVTERPVNNAAFFKGTLVFFSELMTSDCFSLKQDKFIARRFPGEPITYLVKEGVAQDIFVSQLASLPQDKGYSSVIEQINRLPEHYKPMAIEGYIYDESTKEFKQESVPRPQPRPTGGNRFQRLLAAIGL